MILQLCFGLCLCNVIVSYLNNLMDSSGNFTYCGWSKDGSRFDW